MCISVTCWYKHFRFTTLHLIIHFIRVHYVEVGLYTAFIQIEGEIFSPESLTLVTSRHIREFCLSVWLHCIANFFLVWLYGRACRYAMKAHLKVEFSDNLHSAWWSSLSPYVMVAILRSGGVSNAALQAIPAKSEQFVGCSMSPYISMHICFFFLGLRTAPSPCNRGYLIIE